MTKRIVSSALLVCVLMLATVSGLLTNGWAWSNGGYSEDPSNPDYGTHDWIAQHALDWLPTEEKQYLLDNLAAYLYGTELPDNGGAPDGIGDFAKHHIYYWSNGSLQDGASATRASEEYSETLNFLEAKDYAKAAKNAGIMSHYIADVAVFAHVMGTETDWGKAVHHTDDYEPDVNNQTSSYNAPFNSYLSFDGSLNIISAHEAAKNLAYDTTFDVDGDLTCIWMDQNYDWSNSIVKDRAGESLNLAVNYLSDVLHTLYQDAAPADTAPPATTISLSGVFGDNDWFTSDVSVTLSATDDTKVDKTKYSFDNATWITYTTPFTITNEGDNIVYYKSTDKAGNPEAIKTKTIKIDKTIPSGSISTANVGQDQTVTVGATINFDASGSTDNLGIISYEWNFGDGSTGTGVTTTYTYTKEGTYTVKLTLKDAAGNTDTHQITIRVLSAEVLPMWAIAITILLVAGIALGTIAIIKHKT